MINWIVNIIGPENSFEVFSFILTYVFYLVGTLLFLYKRRHKNKFFLRIIPAIILGFPFAFGLALLNKTAIGTSFTIITRMLCYHSLSAYIFALLLFCYDEPIADLCLLWCCGICAQHIANKTYPLIQNIFGINDTETLSLFHKNHEELQTWEFLLYFAIIIGLLFLLAYIFRKSNVLTSEKRTRRKVAILSIGFTVVINGIICVSRLYERESMALSINLKLFTISFCILIMSLAAGMFEQSKKDKDYLVIKELLHQEKIQFENTKTNMEAINTKVHDLKKIINKVEDKLNEQDVESLKKALEFYDSTIQTGNDVLDVVLCEKSLLCRQSNIKFSCMADASKLDMLTPTQIYSIFGNIMDNAIRASKQLNEDQRFISLTIKEQNEKIVIEETNFFKGTIKILEGNTIATSKADKAKHGFGLKSINYIVEKYQGKVELDIKNNCFDIIIVLPIKKEN
ncbi:MAG: GHKL domain-containing protein [Bacilli bacterium]|nr:GHKL domain-containing protein [Bacilli bacterium]